MYVTYCTTVPRVKPASSGTCTDSILFYMQSYVCNYILCSLMNEFSVKENLRGLRVVVEVRVKSIRKGIMVRLSAETRELLFS